MSSHIQLDIKWHQLSGHLNSPSRGDINGCNGRAGGTGHKILGIWSLYSRNIKLRPSNIIITCSAPHLEYVIEWASRCSGEAESKHGIHKDIVAFHETRFLQNRKLIKAFFTSTEKFEVPCGFNVRTNLDLIPVGDKGDAKILTLLDKIFVDDFVGWLRVHNLQYAHQKIG